MDSVTFLQDLSATLLKFRESQLLCDTMLVITGGDNSEDELCFWAHSIILAAASSTLCAAFTERKAAPQWCRFRVLLPNCDPTAVEVVLHFLYTGQLNLPSGFHKSADFAKIFAVCDAMGVPMERFNGIQIAFSSHENTNSAVGVTDPAPDLAPVPVLGLNQPPSEHWLHPVEPKDEESSNPALDDTETILNHDNISPGPGPGPITEAGVDSNSTPAMQYLNKTFRLSLERNDSNLEFGKTCNRDLSDFSLLARDGETNYISCPKELNSGSAFRKSTTSPVPVEVKPKITIFAKKLVSCLKQRHKSNLKSSHSATYICTACSRSFTRLLWFKAHMKRFHEGSTALFTCSTCSRTFLTRQQLRTHEFLHTTHRPHICDVCGKAYRFQSSLVQHANTAHSGGQRPYLCELCGSAFAIPVALRRHKQRRHLGYRPHCCTKCGKQYTARYQLSQHQLSCHAGGVKPYSCKLCGTSFTLRCNMLRHEQLHDNPSTHMCPLCGKVFRQKQNLTEHVKRFHVSATETQPMPNKRHVCTVCSKSYRTEATLLRHMLQHTASGRTHICSVCNKGFTEGRYLTAHMVVHKEKQNICPVCSRRFVRAPYLEAHMKKKHLASGL